MGEVKLTAETMRLIALFEQVTRARVKDCIDEEDRLTFVVPEADLGRAIGKQASNLKLLRDRMKKEVEVVGFSEDIEKFLRLIFHKFTIESVTIEDRADGTKVGRVKVDPKDKGKAIGKGGRNVQLARNLATRHSALTEVVVD